MPSMVASLFGVLSLDDSGFTKGLDNAEKQSKGFGERLKGMGDSITVLGASMTAVSAPFIAGMGYAVSAALEFDSSMTNVQSVLGATDADMAVMSASVLELGSNSRQGAQSAADAFYDIVGGVADATTHMDILNTSLNVADGSSAELGGVVNALVKTMNIYGMSAEDAARAGDVLTRTVGMGVGTMDEFASALPPVEGLAKELGIGFDDLGGMMAYMSTQSSSVAEGGTALKGVFSKMINPSADLSKAFKKMGYASGEALIEQEGLVGGLKKLKEFGGGSFAGLITDQEALLGAIALTADGADEFFTTYEEGIDGATDAAKAIQMASPAAQIDLLKNSASELAITVGDALLPKIGEIVTSITPVVQSITDWVSQNPELVAQIGTVAAVIGVLGVGLTTLGLIVSVVGGAFAALMSPIGIALAAAAGVVAAYQTNFGGFKDFIDGTVRPAIDEFFKFLADAWTNTIQPGIQPLVDFFTSGEGLQTITAAVDEVGRLVGEAFTTLSLIWVNVLQPALQPIVDWFTSGVGLQQIKSAAEIAKQIVEGAFQALALIWENILKPGLQPIVDWFTSGVGLQQVKGAVEGVKGVIDTAFGALSLIWENILKPGIQPIVDWFTSGTGWQQITEAVTTVKNTIDTVINGISTKIGEFITTVKGVWGAISGAVANIRDGINGVLGGIKSIIDGIAGAFQTLVDAVTGSTVTVSAGGTLNVGGAQAYLSGTTPGNAWGGPVMAGQPTYVGEQGKEIFVPESNGTIVPNNQIGGMGGGDTYNVTVYADSAEGGRAAGDAFGKSLREQRAARG